MSALKRGDTENLTIATQYLRNGVEMVAVSYSLVRSRIQDSNWYRK